MDILTDFVWRHDQRPGRSQRFFTGLRVDANSFLGFPGCRVGSSCEVSPVVGFCFVKMNPPQQGLAIIDKELIFQYFQIIYPKRSSIYVMITVGYEGGVYFYKYLFLLQITRSYDAAPAARRCKKVGKFSYNLHSAPLNSDL